MYRVNLLLSAFIFSAVFLFSCSSTDATCSCLDPSSSSAEKPGSSSSSGVRTSSSSVNGSSSSRGGVDSNQNLVRKDITLSSDKSYADVDGDEPAAYTKEYATNNREKIDLIAYCENGLGYCESSSIIYSPREIDLFWNRSDYIGSRSVVLYEIPDAYANQFKTAVKLSDISTTLTNLIDNLITTSCRDCVSKIPIVAGKVFFVQTSETKIRIAVIEGTGNQSVNLKLILIPSSN